MNKTIQFTGTIVVPDDSPVVSSLGPSNLARSFAGKPSLGEYAGVFVFVEKVKTPGLTSYSHYDNGEYFVLRSTPAVLYATKLVVGYGGHEIKQLPLLGEGNFQILDSYRADGIILDFLRNQKKWLADSEFGKKQWIESVYSNAREVVRQIERTMES